MKFEFYTEALDKVPKLSVDGTVDNSIHFSHWQGNLTPAEVKADTSTEIALNLVSSPRKAELTQNIELVTNNHFDTDGVLSCWTVLNGDRALEFKELLIAAAEAGDFSEYSSENGIKVSLSIQGTDGAVPHDEKGSPFARLLAGESVIDDASAYEVVLPEVERLLTNVNEFESLWRDGWQQIKAAVESFERGDSRVTEFADAKLSLVSLAPEIFAGPFSPTKHSAPYTAISKFAKGEIFIVAISAAGGWFYRIDYPYYSWAETVVRPRISRRDLTTALQLLNEREGSSVASWQPDSTEMTSAVKFLDQQGMMAASKLDPDAVADIIRSSNVR
jgi:hypothetical protein